MKMNYVDFFTNIPLVIDLSKSRIDTADDIATEYCRVNNKRKTARMVENFASTSTVYFKVRDIVEKIDTRNFAEVITRFKEVYPQLSECWKSALKCGLIIKAGSKEGNYSNGEYIFQCETAKELRELGLNFCQPFIDNLFTPASTEQLQLF